jgi:hypothetical protein
MVVLKEVFMVHIAKYIAWTGFEPLNMCGGVNFEILATILLPLNF